MFYNLNANKPDPVTHIVSYNPDPNNPAKSPRDFFVYMGRMTWQANPKNKFGLTYDYEGNCFCPNNVSATRTPKRQPTGASRCNGSCRWTGTRRSAASCCSKPAPSIASSAGAT
jgi:hypothetical protein